MPDRMGADGPLETWSRCITTPTTLIEQRATFDGCRMRLESSSGCLHMDAEFRSGEIIVRWTLDSQSPRPWSSEWRKRITPDLAKSFVQNFEAHMTRKYATDERANLAYHDLYIHAR